MMGSPIRSRRLLGTALVLLTLVAVAWLLQASRPGGAGAPAPARLEDLPPEVLRDVRVPPGQLKGLTPARVVRAVDGDTVEVELGGRREKLRLIGVNTPESVDPRREVQAYGKEAARFTASVLMGRSVYLERDVEERDRYGRLLGYLYLEDGTFFNALLVRAGFAQTMTISPNVRHAGLLRDLMRKARAEERGLWALPAAQRPR